MNFKWEIWTVSGQIRSLRYIIFNLYRILFHIYVDVHIKSTFGRILAHPCLAPITEIHYGYIWSDFAFQIQDKCSCVFKVYKSSLLFWIILTLSSAQELFIISDSLTNEEFSAKKLRRHTLYIIYNICLDIRGYTSSIQIRIMRITYWKLCIFDWKLLSHRLCGIVFQRLCVYLLPRKHRLSDCHKESKHLSQCIKYLKCIKLVTLAISFFVNFLKSLTLFFT